MQFSEYGTILSLSDILIKVLPTKCYRFARIVVGGRSLLSPIPSGLFCILYLSKFGSLLLYARGSVASSSSSLPYVASWFLPSVCRLALATDSENHKPLLPLCVRRVGVMSRTFLMTSRRTGWIVGRHAQIMPRLTSTLDQMIGGEDSSDYVSVLLSL